MIEEIIAHFEKEYPREGCGIIGIVKGKKKWFPCNNLASEDEDFILDPKEFIEVKKQADILAIVHNHIHSSNKASENDEKFCNVLGIPYYIFSYPEMELNILEPSRREHPLIGREYQFGVSDCLEAIRDYYREHSGIQLQRRLPYLDNWWEHGHNYFTEEHLKEWGFNKVSELQPSDLLVFTMGALVPTHCGVYLGNDLFFHHAVNRLSCRENLYPIWKKHLTGIYRYGT
jgi:proteasome lid subunit RPN8/RPN11